MGEHSGQRRTGPNGFTLIELVIVIAVMTIIAAMAIPAFGTTLARARMRANAAQMVQDLRLVRENAIMYQQDLYVYIRTSPASGPTVYYYELFQKVPDPTNPTHYTPTPTSVSGKFVRKVLLYGMLFGVAHQSGSTDVLAATSDAGYIVLAYCCGKGSNFRGQPVVVSNTSTTPPTYAALSGAIGIPIVDSSGKKWYVAISPAGQANSSASPP